MATLSRTRKNAKENGTGVRGFVFPISYAPPLGRFNKTPDAELRETADSYIVTVNLPGADESTFDVRVEDDILKISVKTERLSEDSKSSEQYRRRERFIGEFQRTTTLPGPVESSRM